MVLDSQVTRSDAVRRNMISGRRRSMFRPWMVVLAVVVVIVVYFAWGRGGDEADEGQAATASAATDGARAGERTSAVSSASVVPEPVVIVESRGGGESRVPGPGSRVEEKEDAGQQTKPIPLAAADGVKPPQDDPVTLDMILARVKGNQDKVESRRLLSRALIEQRDELSGPDLNVIRQALTTISQQLVYSTRVDPSDPMASWYKVKSGDALSRVARKYNVTHHFVAAINGLKSPDNIFVDKKLKMIHGPFHAVVEKSAYRMDIYLVDPTGQWLYINSFAVGLGADDSTPIGKFTVRPGGKISDPEWTDPRTGKIWAHDDPGNPVGEYWIGIEGIDQATSDLRGYGIHGTVDPKSIGDQQSMGCVRLRDKDIAMVFKLLVEGESTVVIMR